MKTLWVVNHHATKPTGTTAGARHVLLGEQMGRHGWRTVVLAGSTEHYTGRQLVEGYHLQVTDQFGPVTFRMLRVPRYRGNGAARILNMLAFTLHALAPWSTRGLPPPDAVMGSSVHPLAAWAGARLARRLGVPFHFEIRDLWPETLIQMGALRRDGIVARALRRLEGNLCRRATRIVTTMPYASEYLAREHGVPTEKVAWISNGVEMERFPASTPPSGGAFTFMYFGALGEANALEILLEGFARARECGLGDAVLRIVGQGPARAKLEALVAERELGDVVTIEPAVSRGRIPHLAAEAHVLVVALRSLPLYQYGISLNKLFEYMAAGRPVLFAGRARGNPVDDRTGIVTDCRTDEVAQAFLDFVEWPRETLDAAGDAGRRVVRDRFSFEALAAELRNVLAPSE